MATAAEKKPTPPTAGPVNTLNRQSIADAIGALNSATIALANLLSQITPGAVAPTTAKPAAKPAATNQVAEGDQTQPASKDWDDDDSEAKNLFSRIKDFFTGSENAKETDAEKKKKHFHGHTHDNADVGHLHGAYGGYGLGPGIPASAVEEGAEEASESAGEEAGEVAAGTSELSEYDPFPFGEDGEGYKYSESELRDDHGRWASGEEGPAPVTPEGAHGGEYHRNQEVVGNHTHTIPTTYGGTKNAVPHMHPHPGGSSPHDHNWSVTKGTMGGSPLWGKDYDPFPFEEGEGEKYSENQPREPAGGPGGGQFASAGGGSSSGSEHTHAPVDHRTEVGRHLHQIAKQTLRMPDALLGVMGGPTKEQARMVQEGVTHTHLTDRPLSHEHLYTGRVQTIRAGPTKDFEEGEDTEMEVGTKRNFDPNVGGGVDRDKLSEDDFAGPNRSFPIVKPGDVSDAIHSIGRSKSDPETIKAGIIRIAKRKGFVDQLPDEWKTDSKEDAYDKSFEDTFAEMLEDDLAKEASSFVAFKDTDGAWRWLATSTNKYEDREGEIFPERSHLAYVDYVDRTKDYPELWLWHTPGSRVGVANQIDYADGFVLMTGTFDKGKEEVAEKLANYQEPLGTSHGYRYIKQKSSNVYDYYRSFEMSVLPRRAASNIYNIWAQWTAKAIKEATTMGLSPQKRQFFVSLLGEDGTETVEKSLQSINTTLQAKGVNWKEFSEAVFTNGDGPDPDPKPEPQPEPGDPDPEKAKTLVKAKAAGDVKCPKCGSMVDSEDLKDHGDDEASEKELRHMKAAGEVKCPQCGSMVDPEDLVDHGADEDEEDAAGNKKSAKAADPLVEILAGIKGLGERLSALETKAETVEGKLENDAPRRSKANLPRPTDNPDNVIDGEGRFKGAAATAESKPAAIDPFVEQLTGMVRSNAN
jgi:hypothetical protein